MRDLTKSMLSFSWVLPLFGMSQAVAAATPRDPSRPFGKAAEDFDAVTRAAAGQLGETWRGAFQTGDQLQREVVDWLFSFLSVDAFNPNRVLQMSADLAQRSLGAVGAVAGAATS